MERTVAERGAVVRHDVVVGQHERVPHMSRPAQRRHAAPHEPSFETRFERGTRAHRNARDATPGAGGADPAGAGGLVKDVIFQRPKTIPRSV